MHRRSRGRTLLRRAVACAVVLGAGAVALGTAGPSQASPIIGASFSGRVTLPDGSPAGHVTVEVIDADDRSRSQLGTTAADGTFTVDELPAGTYVVATAPASGTAAGVWGGPGTRAGATRVPVQGGQQVTGIDISLGPPARLTGVVTDATTGRPVPDIDVSAYGGLVQTDSASTTTDDRGRYSLMLGGLGAYDVLVGGSVLPQEREGDAPGDVGYPLQHDGGVPASADVPEQPVSSRGVTVDDISVEPGVTLAGTLLDATDGEPAAGVGVELGQGSSPYGDQYVSGRSDANGQWHIDDLLPGTYDVHYSDKTAPVGTPGFVSGEYVDGQTPSVQVRPGAVTTANGSVVEAGHLSGTVTDPGGRPLAGAEVVATPTGDQPYSGPSTTTDDEGDYRIDGLAPGGYTVSFGPGSTPADPADQDLVDQWWPAADTPGAAQPVELAAGQTHTGIDATLVHGASVSGQVVSAAGTPASGVTVEAVDTAPLGNPIRSIATTDDGGEYSLHALATGSYRIVFTAGPQWADGFWGGALWTDDAPTLSLTQGHHVEGIDGRLAPGGQISGRVLTAEGQPAMRYVVAVPVGHDDEAVDARYATVEPADHFDFEQLRPGTYRLSLACDDTDQPSSGPSVDERVGSGGESRRDLTLPAGVDSDCFPTILPAATPRLVGAARVGRTLRVLPLTTRTPRVLVTYSWWAGHHRLAGALGTTFRLRKALQGARVQVHATLTRAGYHPVQLVSRPTRRVR